MLGIMSAVGSGISAVGNMVGGIMNAVNQKKQLEYQKQLQQQIFQREDNAVQRKAADLQKAGLSKTLAAGGGANAGQVVKTEAPQIHGLEHLGEGLSGGVQNYMQAKQAEEAYKLTQKQIAQVETQNKNLDADNYLKRLEAAQKKWDFMLAREFGMRSSDPLNLSSYAIRNFAPSSSFWKQQKDNYDNHRREVFAREREEYERWLEKQNLGIPPQYQGGQK